MTETLTARIARLAAAAPPMSARQRGLIVTLLTPTPHLYAQAA